MRSTPSRFALANGARTGSGSTCDGSLLKTSGGGFAVFDQCTITNTSAASPSSALPPLSIRRRRRGEPSGPRTTDTCASYWPTFGTIPPPLAGMK